MARGCLGAWWFFSWKGFAVVAVFDQSEALDHTTAVYGLAAEAGVGEAGPVSPLLVLGTIEVGAEAPCAPGESSCKGLQVSASCRHPKR